MKKDDDDVKKEGGPGEVLEPWVEPAMEVRLVALALGEASEFERAELEEAMGEEPELKVFYERMVGADRLLGEVLAKGENDRLAEWRMETKRREALLERIRGSEPAGRGGADAVDEVVVATEGGRRSRKWVGHLGSMAAALIALIAIGGLFLPLGNRPITGMMPASGVVSERPSKREARFGFLFDMDQSESAVQLAEPEEMSVGAESIRRYRHEGPREEGLMAQAETRPVPSRESLVTDLATVAKEKSLAPANQPLAILDEVASATEDYGLTTGTERLERTDGSVDSEVPRLASVPVPAATAPQGGEDRGRVRRDYAMFEAKDSKLDGGESSNSVFYADELADRVPSSTHWGFDAGSGRVAGQEDAGGEIRRGYSADSRTSGGYAGGGAAVAGEAMGELGARGLYFDGGEEAIPLAKKRAVAKPPVVAGTEGISERGSLAEVQTPTDPGVGADAIDAILAETARPGLGTEIEAQVSTGGVVSATAESKPAPAAAAVAVQNLFGSRLEEDDAPESSSTRTNRSRFANEEARAKFKSGDEGAAVLGGVGGGLEKVAELELELVENAKVPDIENTVVRSLEALTVAEADVEKDEVITDLRQDGLVREHDHQRWNLEGEARSEDGWFDRQADQPQTRWGRPREFEGAQQGVGNERGVTGLSEIEDRVKLVDGLDKFGESLDVFAGTTVTEVNESLMAAEGEVPPAWFKGASDGSQKLGEDESSTPPVDFRAETMDKKSFLFRDEMTIESVDPAASTVELARESQSVVGKKVVADFDGDFDGGLEVVEKKVEALSPEQVTSFSVAAAPEEANKRVKSQRSLWEEATAGVETATAEEAFSTFSLHVSDVSFKLAAAALLENGTWPEADKVRVEEFVNAFDYGDPGVSLKEKVGCRTEQAAHPFLQQRNLVRVSMRAAAAGRAGGQPLRLTVLLDKSGSMEREDREASVAKAMDALASHLTADDVITVIGFARTPRLIADRMSGDRAGELAKLVAQAPSEGGTNLEEALGLAREVALRQHLDGGVNRIVLMTDGAANLGNARPEALSEMVVRLRNEGVAFDACGVGADGLNDEILEALTREGDGRYYFLNRAEDADEGFVRQLAGALRPAAKNVKVQVEFNPERVRGYRLLGFEKHRLAKEDFRNDAVDAAEMAAEEAGVAVYQTEVMAGGSGDLGKVWVRFQDTATGEMVERSWRIPYEAGAPRLGEAPASMKLAGTAVLLGERLKGGAGGALVDLAELAGIAAPLRQDFAGNERVEKLVQMIEAARNLEQ